MTPQFKEPREGWGFPQRSQKAHYFTEDGRSLCGKWGFYHGDVEQGNGDSADNCTACKKALQRRKAKEVSNKLSKDRKIQW